MKLIRQRSLQILIAIWIGILLLAGVLQIPVVQKHVVVGIGNWATEQSGLHIELEQLRLKWWKGQIALNGLQIRDDANQCIVRADEIRVGFVLKSDDQWVVKGFEWTGGTVDVARALKWYQSQEPSSEPQATNLHWRVELVALQELRCSLPADWAGGGEVVLNLEDTQIDYGPAEWHVNMALGKLHWNEVHAASLHRPHGRMNFRQLHVSSEELKLRLEANEFTSLGWKVQGQCAFDALDTYSLESADLDWEYDPVEGGSWWDEFSGYPLSQQYWADEVMSGSIAAQGHSLTFNKTLLPAGLSIQEGFNVKLAADQGRPAWNGLIQLNLPEAQSWMERKEPELSNQVPWNSLALWLGNRFQLHLASAPKDGIELELHSMDGASLALLSMDEAFTKANLRLNQLNAADWEINGPKAVSVNVNLASAPDLIEGETLQVEATATHADSRFPRGTLQLLGEWNRSQRRAQGDATISGNTLPMNLAVEASYDSLQWEIAWAGKLEGVSPDGGSSVQLFASCSGKLTHQSNGSIDANGFLRNSVLLHHGRPITFERFDVFCSLRENELDVRWESDLGVGNVQADPNVTAWKAWWEASKLRHARAVMPRIQADVQLRRFKPVALLAQIPLELTDGTRVQGHTTPDGFTLQAESPEAAWGDFRVQELNLQMDGWDNEIFANVSTSEIFNRDESLASDAAIDVHGDSLWTADLAWVGMEGADTRIRLVARDHAAGWEFRLYEASVPWLTDRLELAETPARIDWFSGPDPALEVDDLNWTTKEARFEVTGKVDKTEDSNLQINATFNSLPSWAGIEKFGLGFDSARLQLEACDLLQDPKWFASGEINGLNWPEHAVNSFAFSGAGNVNELNCAWDITDDDRVVLNGIGRWPFNTAEKMESTIEFNAFPLSWLNPWLPAGTVELTGGMSGKAHLSGSIEQPELTGTLHAQDVEAKIKYLGIDLTLNGTAQLYPDYFAFDGWKVTDDLGTRADLTGTILHRNFQDWNFDLSVDATKAPIHLMELTRTQNDLFYGRAFATGDANVSGYSDNLVVEARLTTAKGTEFALPLDAASDARYADFIAFYNPESAADKSSMADLSRVRMDLALDITEDAKARIIFDESVGDELSGSTRGALNLSIDDFERFTMNGQLEVVEGAYLFTLQQVINKRFTIQPGGTLTWFGDPYAADIDLDAGYEIRTGLDPLLPQEANLPGRTKVALEMGMLGNLMRPTISFDVQVPEVDGRLQALVKSALINEEELNRQVMGLLVLQQFLSPDPTAAIGTTGLQEKSTEFLASQIGFWLSQLTQDVNVGVDYGTDATSGEQALAVALSAQLLDDRLHIEGAVGTNHLFSGSTQDLQVQDIRVKYDLPPDGTFQVTGYTSTSPDIAGTTGSTTQGVGVLMQSEFDSLNELWQRIWKRAN